MSAGRRPGSATGGRQSFIEAARRQQLIEAAISVVSQVGYAQASVARIAQEAGISKGLISYHFRNKEDLLQQALRTTWAAISASVTAPLDPTAPAPTVLRALLERTAEYGAVHRGQFRALSEIARNLRDEGERPLLSLKEYEGVFQGLEQLCLRGQREGSFRAFNARVMAVTYQAAVDAMFEYADAYPNTDLTAYAADLATLLLEGLQADKA